MEKNVKDLEIQLEKMETDYEQKISKLMEDNKIEAKKKDAQI